MAKKIYFAGSIRGGRVDAELYRRIIAFIQRTDIVLTEHVGKSDLSLTEQGRERDARIDCSFVDDGFLRFLVNSNAGF